MALAAADWPAFRDSFHWHEEDDAGGCNLSPEDALSYALKGQLTAEEAVALSLPGKKVDELLPIAIRMGLTDEELLLVQLLSSFDLRGEDPELLQCSTVKGPKVKSTEFFLFMIKASAKSGQISWWKKKKSRFSPERPGYIYALWIARLGADGIHLEQAGEGGQPGAISYHIDTDYTKLRRPKGVVVFEEGSDVPLREVALIRRLPSGDGISITSHVRGLGVQLGGILFILPCCAATVAVSFTEQSFTLPTEFTEEPLYGRVGLNFIDITVPVENLIKKLYNMYKQNYQNNKTMNEQHNKGDHEKRSELMYFREEKEKEKEKEELIRQKKKQEKEKRESLQRRRAESKENRCKHKELKKMFRNVNLGAKAIEEVQDREYEEDNCFCNLFSSPPDSNCENPLEITSPEELGMMDVLEMELCERENMHTEFLEKPMRSMKSTMLK